MSTTERGRTAEDLAARHLESLGQTILSRNWRNRWCELDIVTKTSQAVHFVEVKYRRDVRYGYAAEYISRDKMQRLARAAAAWNQAHKYRGPYQIDVVAVEGELERPTMSYLPNVVQGQ